jgi:hypothetical protein
MKILILTHSSPNGLNQRQAMECMNVIGFPHEYQLINDPELLKYDSVEEMPDRIIMIVPEWNGSFPYSFKKLIDDSGWPSWLKSKKILLIGTSNTTFGNIMGITHLKQILEWIGADVSPKLVCVPKIQEKFANNDIIVDPRLNETVIEFCS